MLVLLDHDGCAVARTARWRDRILSRLCGHRLDAELARGACPDATMALALRAQTLVSMAARRDLARSAERILAAAMRTPTARRLPVPVCRDLVSESSDDLAGLISRLLAEGPVSARGVAKASILLCDARGPLYHRASADSLRASIREAAAALGPLDG